ncbi:MAG TPA: hypothetical protein DCR11_00885 [Deltaproteobacteria bacterium]|nr:hypothetical protein [Deltaproteobacteria bacterium]
MTLSHRCQASENIRLLKILSFVL